MNKKHFLPEKEICNRYQKGESTCKLGIEFNCADSVIRHVLEKHQIPRRKRGESNRLYTLDQNVFSKITDESAYWAGFLMADGCLSYKGNNRYVVSLEISYKDVDHLIKYQTFLKTNKPITRRQRKIYNGTIIDIVCLEICSQQIYNDLIKNFNVTPNKSLDAKAHINIEKNRHFWRGMIDGDGCICNKINDNLGSFQVQLVGSQSICTQLQQYLKEQVGLKSNVLAKGSIFSINANGQYGMQLCEIMYKNTKLYLQRKKDKWLERCQQITKK